MIDVLPDLDILIRLLVATFAGMAIGLNRDLRNKPTGIRTLGLVSLGAALITVATIEIFSIHDEPDAASRVIQGLIQGIMAGIGFIGAGVVLRDPEELEVHGLTTAASVWVTAALGVASGLGAWHVVGIGAIVALLLLFAGHPLERLLANRSNDEERKD